MAAISLSSIIHWMSKVGRFPGEEGTLDFGVGRHGSFATLLNAASVRWKGWYLAPPEAVFQFHFCNDGFYVFLFRRSGSIDKSFPPKKEMADVDQA